MIRIAGICINVTSDFLSLECSCPNMLYRTGSVGTVCISYRELTTLHQNICTTFAVSNVRVQLREETVLALLYWSTWQRQAADVPLYEL